MGFLKQMIKCKVEMWGIPREVSGLPEVDVSVKDDAGLPEVIAALKRKVPKLEGQVIRSDQDRLEETCIFNYEGQFITEDERIKLKDGDVLRLLTLATGG